MAWEASVKEQELEHESADALYVQKIYQSVKRLAEV
jgi:hypothetical protein